jgi:hypothetical protein
MHVPALLSIVIALFSLYTLVHNSITYYCILRSSSSIPVFLLPYPDSGRTSTGTIAIAILLFRGCVVIPIVIPYCVL